MFGCFRERTMSLSNKKNLDVSHRSQQASYGDKTGEGKYDTVRSRKHHRKLFITIWTGLCYRDRLGSSSNYSEYHINNCNRSAVQIPTFERGYQKNYFRVIYSLDCVRSIYF